MADAARLAHQASFGPNEALLGDIRNQGAAGWVSAQMQLASSRYTLGGGDAVHKATQSTTFCELPANATADCWRDWNSTTPLVWDFYRNATQQPDQLRQRVAFALQQILVINNNEVTGTYGFRNYYNNLLGQAFGNYRQVLKTVSLSPLMGEFLNNVNNHKAAPNENYSRELLQLFALGTCMLNADGSLGGGLNGGTCTPTYNNDNVRAYAYALTGWTYPAGGATSYGCWPAGANCRYFGGDMAALPAFHDTAARQLLSNVSVPANSTPAQALELVLDSLMLHPNMAPFVGKQLIQHLVSANPSPAYVQRVASAFASGRFSAAGLSFGAGLRGDLAATVAAVLLDSEARSAAPAASAGKLREPVLFITGVLRALNGSTDGDALGWWWGEVMHQHVFRPPSVFNFYPPDYPVAGTALVGPSFGIHNSATALERLNFLTYMLMWNGSEPASSVPGAVGTRANLAAFAADAADAAKLVDRLAVLATGAPLPGAARSTVVNAVQAVSSANGGDWANERVRQAAYLVFASPQYQVQR